MLKRQIACLVFLVACALIVVSPMFPQNVTKEMHPSWSRSWEYGTAYLTTTPTTIIDQDTDIETIRLVNESVGTVSVNITELALNCAGAGCKVLPDITLNGRTVSVIPLGRTPAFGGFKISASVGGAVNIYMRGAIR